MKIVLATHNKHKIIEIKEALKELDIDVLSLDDFPDMPDVLEDGLTLEENSLKKAKEIHRYTKLMALADDTGLEVEALGGAPGVFSARYAGEDCNFKDNCELLLNNLRNKRNRKAKFRTVATLYGEGVNKVAVGEVIGEIIMEYKGSEGFGYDPIFKPDDFDQTFAQMPLEVKNRISHRGNALRKMVEIIKQL